MFSFNIIIDGNIFFFRFHYLLRHQLILSDFLYQLFSFCFCRCRGFFLRGKSVKISMALFISDNFYYETFNINYWNPNSRVTLSSLTSSNKIRFFFLFFKLMTSLCKVNFFFFNDEHHYSCQIR
jgi:hypothetical protein